MNKIKNKIALFYGGKITKHLRLIAKAAKQEKVELDLISYNQVCFDTVEGRVKLRDKMVDDYDVLFFRTTGKHWEEVDLVVESLKLKAKSQKKQPIIVDPLVLTGKPSFACKAYQMLALEKAGIGVPRSIYGSLWYLYEVMENTCQTLFLGPHASAEADMIPVQKKQSGPSLDFPVILKGSGGDRGTRVFKANNLEELEKLIRQLRKSETEEGKRYMLQEYIENKGDYRVLVLGDKVLGVMKRTSQSKEEFRNNFSTGGKAEIADLPEAIKAMAVRAAKACGLAIAGVDIIYKPKAESLKLKEECYVLEVNKGPQFWGFMEATGIDVPREIVRFLKNLQSQNLPLTPSLRNEGALEINK